MAKLLLTGFDPASEEILSRKIAEMGYDFERVRCDALGNNELASASGVIASGEEVRCVRLLRRLREANSSMPFILVDRLGDDANWLKALERGATDYCSLDVDPANLHWILKNSLPRTYRVSASAA